MKALKTRAVMVILALFLGVSGCGLISEGENEALDMDWELRRLDGYSTSLPEQNRPIMTLDAEEVSGNTGVNTFSGTFDWKSDGSFTFGPLMVTEMAGSPELMEIERLLLEAFEKTAFYELSNAVLILSDKDGNFLVSFDPVPED